MKIAVFYHHLCEAAAQTGLPLADILDQAREACIEAVDLDLAQPNFDDAVREIRAHGLCVSSLYHNYDLGLDPTTARRHVETARALSLRSLLVVPGFLTDADALWLANSARWTAPVAIAQKDLLAKATLDDFRAVQLDVTKL